MEGVGRVVANPKNLRTRYLTRINTFLETLQSACFERGISYSQCGLLRSYGHVLNHLHAVGAPLRAAPR